MENVKVKKVVWPRKETRPREVSALKLSKVATLKKDWMCLKLKNRKVTFAPDTERTLLTLPLKGESFHWDYRAMIGKSSSLRTCLGVSSEACTYLYILDSDKRQVLLYLSGKATIFDWAYHLEKDVHGEVKKDVGSRLASQMGPINHSDQLGGRCHSQITLTSIV